MTQEPLIGGKTEPTPLTDRLEAGILPLINLVFLLLMFFLMVGVIAEDPLPDLPGNNASQVQEQPAIDFAIDKDGILLQDGQAVALTALPEVIRQVEAKRQTEAGGSAEQWRIGADQSLTMADLEEILAAFHRAGIDTVQLLTEPDA